MTERKDRIRIQIGNQAFNVVGGGFQDMLAAVKQINGRRFVSALKVWQLPGSIEEVQRQLEISGYRLEEGSPAAPDTPAPAAPQPGAPADRIRVWVAGHQLAVVGSTFQDMLAVVKSLPGRRFNGDTKMWEIPGDPAVIKGVIEGVGLQLEGSEHIALGPPPSIEPLDFLAEPAKGYDSRPFLEPDFFDEETPGPSQRGGPRPRPAEPVPSEDEAPFLNEVEPPEPPSWWDDRMPPPLEEDPGDWAPLDDPAPFEPAQPGQPSPAAAPAAKRSGDRIRIRLGDQPLVVTGGSFQEMLAVIKNIPGRRFNGQEKIWEISGSRASLQQTLRTAGLSLTEPE